MRLPKLCKEKLTNLKICQRARVVGACTSISTHDLLSISEIREDG